MKKPNKKDIIFLAIAALLAILAGAGIWWRVIKIEWPTIDTHQNNIITNNDRYQNGSFTKFIYTDEVVNPFTGEKFMIKKDKDGQCGGDGGAEICDLIVKHQDGAEETVINLFDSSKERKYYNDGAYLIKFTTSENLIIGFKGSNYSVCDCGGENKSIKELNVKTKAMIDVVNYMAFSSMSGREFYKIQTKFGDLIFVNSFIEKDPEFNSKGVFLKQGNEMFEVDSLLAPSYAIDFDPGKNYQNPKSLNIKINSKIYEFDFDTKKFLSIQ